MTAPTPGGIPAKPLLVLTAAVVLVHAALLVKAAGHVQLSGGGTQAFTVRALPAPVMPVVAFRPEASIPVAAARPTASVQTPPIIKPRAASRVASPTVPLDAALAAQESSKREKEEKTAEALIDIATAAPEIIANTSTAALNTAPPDPSPTTTLATAPPASSTPDAAYQLPPSIELAFNATALRDGQPLQGAGRVAWRSDGTRYELRYEASALFINLFTQISTGSVGAQGLSPERFSDKRLRRSELATHFDRASAQIRFSNNRPAAPLQAGAQDRASVPLQLAALLAGQPERYRAGAVISFQVAGAEEADVWTFNVLGLEQASVPAGSVQALRVTRLPRREFDARLDMWFAPSLYYLPIRIVQTEANGNSNDLVLRSPALP